MKDTYLFHDPSLREFLRKHNLDKLPITKLEIGLSNDNYLLGDNYVLKVPYDKRFILLSEAQLELQKEASLFFISPKVICSEITKGFLVTEYLKGYSPLNVKKATYLQIREIINQIKSLHKLHNPSLRNLDYEKDLDHYRLMITPKERIYVSKIENSSLLYKDEEITHFDLVNNNILFNKKGGVKIIDYELSLYAPKYFDLISLLYENDFSSSLRKAIVDEYFVSSEEEKKDFLNKRKILKEAADLYWYHWAQARKTFEDETRQEEYASIARDKKISLIESIRGED